MKPRVVDTVLVLIVGVLAYSNTLHAPFTFDDAGQIAASWAVRHLPTALQELPFAPRAVGRLTFALNHAVHGLDVAGYHLVNLAIHLLTALALSALARTALRAAGDADEGRLRLAGLAAALLFVVHPVQTQAVTYVVQRYSSLAALLYVASLLLYARSRLEADRIRSAIEYVGSMLAAFLAMRVKETAFTVPIALALYEILFVRAPARERLRRLAVPVLLLVAVPLLYLRAHAPDGAPQAVGTAIDTVARDRWTASRFDYLLTQARVIVTYLRLLVLPVGQNVDYDYPVSHSLDLGVCASALGLAALLGVGTWLAWTGRRRASAPALVAGFGILFFFLALSVESSIVPIRDVIAEHRVYLPSVGVFMAAGVGIAVGQERFRHRFQRLGAVPIAALAAIVVLLGVATWSRNQLWADPVALWSDAAAKSPGKLRPVLNWAGALRKRGDREAALEVSLRGLSLTPTDSEELLAMATVYRQIGDLQNARRMLEESLRLRPYFAYTLMALGSLAWDEGNRVAARDYFQRAVDAEPLLSGAHLKLAVALHEAGEVERAFEEFELFIRYAQPAEAAQAAEVARMLRERRAAVAPR